MRILYIIHCVIILVFITFAFSLSRNDILQTLCWLSALYWFTLSCIDILSSTAGFWILPESLESVHCGDGGEPQMLAGVWRQSCRLSADGKHVCSAARYKHCCRGCRVALDYIKSCLVTLGQNMALLLCVFYFVIENQSFVNIYMIGDLNVWYFLSVNNYPLSFTEKEQIEHPLHKNHNMWNNDMEMTAKCSFLVSFSPSSFSITLTQSCFSQTEVWYSS